ncbi:conserved hypothetical protein [Thermocrinis albus DSM 14484]|uniref:Porin n=1 Tax=Thermocrinis albus (strain DSM 14484 / JCM 11386 / HI 11/12) TaxID=638303 RepID=D3SMG5_THEAH|nr:porin [Thermocrinis albus]ADC89945.1 conserved hypothetical protein [Thermocrinis albus DSM 14484]
MKKYLLLTALTGCVFQASALELKTDFMGSINVNGALTGYILYSNNKTDNKKTRYDVGSAIIQISKPAEPWGFNLMGGAYSLPVVGVGLSKTATYTDLYSALPVAYLELTPVKGLSIKAGRLPTIIGYESAFTYLNNYIQRGLVWNMQPVFHQGVRVSYSTDLLGVTLGVNDGFFTASTAHAKAALEGSIALTPVKDGSIAFNFLIPSKSSRPNNTAAPANKREYNLVASYSIGNLTAAVDALYVEAPADSEAQVPSKAKASGVALHLAYNLKPFKVAGRIEYVKDNSDVGGIDLVGLGDGNKAWTFTLTPSYSKGPLFVRGELSYVAADRPFTSNSKKNQTRLGVEVGFLF